MTESVITWRESWRRLRCDAQRSRRYQLAKFGYAPLTWFFDPGWLCIWLYRLSYLMWSKGHQKTGRLFMQINSLATGADIQPACDLGGGLLIPSPCGVTISAKAGDNFVALALAGVGGSVRDKDIGAGVGLPILGNNVVAGQFTGIQGSIRLGDNVIVEAGAGVVVDMADGSRIALAVEPRPGFLPAAPEQRLSRPEPCGHARWRQTRADFSADIARYLDEMSRYGPADHRSRKLSAILSNPMLATLVYRISHWLLLNRHHCLAMALCRVNLLLHKLTIPPESCIGAGMLMPHLAGTIFSGRAGPGLTLFANSLCTGMGSAFAGSAGTPVLGEGVMIGGHSGVFGPVTVGDGVQLGPKVQLAEHAGDGTQVWSSMARGSDRRRVVCEASRPDAVAANRPPPSPPLRLPADQPWRETRRRLRLDRARLRQSADAGEAAARPPFFPALACVWLFRLSHYCQFVGRRRLSRWCWLANVYLTGADISPCCEIGGGLLIPHPAGIALHCRAGDDLTVMATAGVATSLDAEGRLRDLDQSPQLGNGVHLSHHSGIYGDIAIGCRVYVASGCIVTKSVASGTTLVPRHLKIRRTTPAPPPRNNKPDVVPRPADRVRNAVEGET